MSPGVGFKAAGSNYIALNISARLISRHRAFALSTGPASAASYLSIFADTGLLVTAAQACTVAYMRNVQLKALIDRVCAPAQININININRDR
jgi:hypothetical protein